MRKRLSIAAAIAALAILANAQTKADRSLQVKLNYTGAGTVDDKHKILVFLFDSPDFAGGNVMPIGSESAAAKSQTVTFSNLSASPVYVVAVFDPKGEYDGMSMPPSGSSLGLYATQDGKPNPINLESGKAAQINLPFDDSTKMP